MNKFQQNIDWSSDIFNQGGAFENVIYEMIAPLARLLYVNTSRPIPKSYHSADDILNFCALRFGVFIIISLIYVFGGSS